MSNIPSPHHPAAPDTTGTAPVPPQIDARHNGWTREKMKRFIELLAENGSVSQAAKQVGMARQSAYRLRARLIGQPFDLAWEAAFEFSLQQVAHEAVDRALNGVSIPIYYMGEQVGERRAYSESGALNLMMNADRIGRLHFARDAASRDWVDMVQRVGDGPIVWTDEEMAHVKTRKAEREAEQFAREHSNYRPLPPEPPKRSHPRIRSF
jgi:hypothetical protein